MPEKIEKIASSKILVVDTSVLFYLTRAGLIEKVLECWHVVIPESVKVESLRKGCKESVVLKKLIEEGKIEVRKDFCSFPAEDDVVRIAVGEGIPMIVDDGRIVKEAFKREILFTSSPMIPVLLFLKDKLDFEETVEKVNEILERGYFGENVKNFMKEVLNFYRGL